MNTATPAPVIVSVPDESIQARLQLVPGAEFTVWDMLTPPPPGVAFAVMPFRLPTKALENLAGTNVSVVQSQSIGYDGVAEKLPAGITFCNGVGVHEASTAELALTLTLASLRGVPDFVRAQGEGRWVYARYESLAGKRVLIIGHGGIGQAAAARFRPFEVELDRVASRNRTDAHGSIHAFTEIADLLPHADVTVIAVPLTERTHKLVDDAFLSRMKPGALLVNVSRGSIVDTDALLEHARTGKVRAALDVTDPEPLPAEHPLWQLPGVLISPHVGGNTDAMAPRVDRLVHAQTARLLSGQELLNIVLQT